MATLEALKSEKMISVHGRRLGIDKDDFLLHKGSRRAITAATSDTTGTAIPNYGIVSVETSTDDTWILTDPVEGCEVHLCTVSTSTGVRTVTCDNATISSTNGIEGASVLLSNRGAYCSLVGLSTALWGVTSKASTAVASVSS